MRKFWFCSLLLLLGLLYCANLIASPIVLKARPSISEKNVKTNVVIEIYFNEEMDDKSINEQTFKVIDEKGKGVKGEISYDKDSKKAYFKPDDHLKEGTVYLVVLSHNIKSKKGEIFGQAYRWVFKTRGKSKNKSNNKINKVTSKLLPPTVINPKNKSTVTNKVKFEWKGSGDKYHIKIFKGKKVVLDKKLAGNSFEIDRELPKGVYTWKIRMAKGKKWSGFSPKMYFIVESTEAR